ncbi:MAG: L,D-transpeptidase family protein [Alphaproteobacteria bacterium]|nr:L,D-transpeptidase family protein [Alphaproteobacteria bacterium]
MRTRLQLIVTARPGSRTEGILRVGHLILRCALGRSGIRALKKEGDGASPRGVFPVRNGYFRADRIYPRPSAKIVMRCLRRDDGWCDGPLDRNYNRWVRHPYNTSAERLWRKDHLYDVVIVVGYNDMPRSMGKGSAIFIHLAREREGQEGFEPTEGCIAFRERDLKRLMAYLRPGMRVRIGV